MQAMIAQEPGPVEDRALRAVELPDPLAGPGQVRVRVHCCAVCRTDLHVIEGDLPRARMPIIPGHQVVGIVDQLGEGCTQLKIGQRVGIAWLAGVCGQCRFCTSGRENLCSESTFTGYHEHGGYAQYAVAAEDFAYPLPEAFDDIHAAPLLCAGIIGYRALARANVPNGGRLALIGFGSSAHIVLQIARHRGCEVYVTARDASHRRMAQQMGSVWAGPHPDDLPVKVDSAILFAPAGELVPPTLRKLERGGTLACAGIHMTDIPAMSYTEHLFYERDLRSVTCNTREDGRSLLREAAEAGVKPHVRRYELEDANEALCDAKAGRVEGTAVLMVR